MTNYSNNTNQSAAWTLAALSCMPFGSALAQERDPLRGLSGAPFVSAANDRQDLPKRIIDMVAGKDWDLASIKLEKDQWIHCTDAGCAVIAQATQEEILAFTSKNSAQEELKQETKTSSAKKSGAEIVELTYKPGTPGALSLVGDLLLGERERSVVLIVSVPSECPPCRKYKEVIVETAAQKAEGDNTLYIIVNFATYTQAEQKMGKMVTRFPWTGVFPPIPEGTTMTLPANHNWEEKPVLDQMPRPGYVMTGYVEQGPLRKIVKKSAELLDTTVRGLKQVPAELLRSIR